jgi:hypothetical protein
MSKVLICPAIYPAVQGSPLNAANAANILAGGSAQTQSKWVALVILQVR